MASPACGMQPQPPLPVGLGARPTQRARPAAVARAGAFTRVWPVPAHPLCSARDGGASEGSGGGGGGGDDADADARGRTHHRCACARAWRRPTVCCLQHLATQLAAPAASGFVLTGRAWC
jgi:hypothetical protein